MVDTSVEHVVQDATGGFPDVKIKVEFDLHGLTIHRMSPEEDNSSCICLDLQDGEIRVYTMILAESKVDKIASWGDFGFKDLD